MPTTQHTTVHKCALDRNGDVEPDSEKRYTVYYYEGPTVDMDLDGGEMPQVGDIMMLRCMDGMDVKRSDRQSLFYKIKI